MLLRRALAFAALALACSASSGARAESPADTARARELFVEGAKLAESGRWDEARDRFERSLAHRRAAITLYNLGIAQDESGRPASAIATFRAFLAMPVEPATQGYVEPVKAAMTRLESRVGRVLVDVRPAGAPGLSVLLDGREQKPEAGGWAVDPGKHEIRVAAPQYVPVRHEVAVAKGDRATLVVALAPAPPRSTVPIVLGASGLALFVGGEIAFVVGAARGFDSPSDRGPAKAMVISGNVAAGLGAIAAGVGLALLLQKPSSEATALAVRPWFAGSVVGAEVRF
jgi:hypothetical protein